MPVSEEQLAEQYLKGRTVKIYEDPLTRKVFEGYATIISVQSYDKHEWWTAWDGTFRKGMARCSVLFKEGEPGPYDRRVAITDNEEEDKASTSSDMEAMKKAQEEWPSKLDYIPESYKFESISR